MRCSLAFATIVLLSASLSGPASAQPASYQCPAPGTPDYLAPLRTLPSIKRVPSSGIIPFAPHSLRLEPTSDLVVGKGPVGFRISAVGDGQRVTLDWWAELSVAQVNQKGLAVNSLPVKRFWLGDAEMLSRKPRELTTAVPARSGFYRSTLVVRSVSGELLGRYSEYARVVPPRVKVTLSLTRATAVAGETLHLRVQNQGTVGVTIGQTLSLERRAVNGWEHVPVGSGFGAPYAFDISGGTVGPCERLLLPSALGPGGYRISKVVLVGSKRLRIYSPFTVTLN